MPTLSRWFIRAALIYLALGITIGSLLLFHKGIPISAFLWRLLPLHIEFLLFGWLLQLVMGVGFWIFPRFQGSRGNEEFAWVAFAFLNGGILLAGLGPVLGLPSAVGLMGRLAEAGAVIFFVLHAWVRIKPPGHGRA